MPVGLSDLLHVVTLEKFVQFIEFSKCMNNNNRLYLEHLSIHDDNMKAMTYITKIVMTMVLEHLSFECVHAFDN
jgi:hypothetical protein